MPERRAEFRQGIADLGRRDAVLTVGLTVALIGVGLLYFGLDHGPAVLSLRTPIDDRIPLVGPFVIAYLSLLPFLVASGLAFLAFRVRLYWGAALAMIGTLAVSYLFYVVLQSHVDRPVVTGGGLFSQLIRDLYATDAPYNAFPSLHAGLATVCAIHWWRTGAQGRVAMVIWAGLLVVSTVFVKQHYVADVVAGVALASIMSVVAHRAVDPRRP